LQTPVAVELMKVQNIPGTKRLWHLCHENSPEKR